jgi:hypothetical protein
MSEDIKSVLTPEEVKAKVVEDYGFDESDEANKPILEKLVNERIESQKGLSTTIEQKAKYRQMAIEAGLIDPKTFEPIKKEVKEVKKTNVEQNSLDENSILEQTVLLNQGMDLDDLKLLKDIRQLHALRGATKTLSELKEDPMFLASYQAKLAKREEEKASLPPSKGGTKKETQPDFVDKKTGRFDHTAHEKWVQSQIGKG